MKHLKIRALIFTLLGIGMLITVISSFSGAYFLQKETKKAIRMDSLNQAFHVNKEMAGLYDRITDAYASYEDEMYQSLAVAQKYFKDHGREAPLQPLKKALIRGRKETTYEVFEINSSYVVDKTTYPNDLGLDFKNWEAPYKLLKHIYHNPESIDLSLIIHSASLVDMRRFIVQRAQEGEYIIQLGLTLNRKYLQQESISSLQKQTPNLRDTKVYQIFGTDRAPKDIERWWMMESHPLNGKPLLMQDDVHDEFKAVIRPMLENDYNDKDRKQQQKFFVDYFKKTHFIEQYFWQDGRYIHRIAMPLSSRFSLYNESISLIIMDFDESEGVAHLNILYLMVGLLWLVLTAFSLLSIRLLFTRIITPLSTLQQKMQANESIALSSMPSVSDEVGSIARVYNQLLKDLHFEIYSNKMLLQDFKTFAGDSIHQIRTPLSVVKIAIEMAGCQNRESLAQIKASLVSMEHTYDTLSYMVHHDTLEYQAQKLDLSTLFQKRIDIFHVVAEAHDISLDVQIDAECFVMMHPTEAEYLIDNNLSNAIKFSQAGKVVSLSLRRRDNELNLVFRNYGTPIKNIQGVFKRHVREDEGREGNGIGLNIVDTICKANKIMIHVDHINKQNIFSYFIEACDTDMTSRD